MHHPNPFQPVRFSSRWAKCNACDHLGRYRVRAPHRRLAGQECERCHEPLGRGANKRAMPYRRWIRRSVSKSTRKLPSNLTPIGGALRELRASLDKRARRS